MNNRKEEQQLDEYLKGESELSDIYKKTAFEEPPAHIDESILSASKKAVQSKSGAAYSTFARNYYVPLSLAAVLVLCVSIVFNIYQDESRDTVTIPRAVMDYEQELPVSTDDLQGAGREEQIIDEVETKADELQHEGQVTVPQTKMEETVISTETAESPTAAKRKAETYQADPKKVEMIWQNKQLEKTEKAAPVTGGERETGTSRMDNEDMPDVSEPLSATDERIILKEEFDYKEGIEEDRGSGEYRSETGAEAGKSVEEYLTAEAWLQQIKAMWVTGEIDQAREQFKLFREHYPGYEQRDLENYFSRATLEQLGGQ